MSRRCSVLVSLLLASLLATAQQAATPAAAQAPAAPKTTAQEEAVYEQISSRVEFQNDGTGVSETAARVRVLSPAGVKDYGLLRFPYARSTATMELLYLRVRKPDGTVVETPLDTAQDVDAEISRVAPTYSDLREKHIAVRGLSPGDVIEYARRETTTKPLAPGQFWFAYRPTRDAVTRDEELTFVAPADRPLLVRDGETAPVVHREGGRQVYVWKWQNPEPRKKKEKADIADLQQQALGLYPTFEVQVTTFRSWDELGKWIASLMADRMQITPEMQARVAQLTKGLATDDQKIAAIYDFVSTQYRYINIAFGIGRYQPHTAEEVFSYGYGDCKDKHTLLAALLKAAGIEAYPALISAYHLIDEKLPSPQQFDHMITYVPRPGGKALWLDTTAEVAPVGVLLPLLRDKQALVVRNGTATLERTPVNLPGLAHETFEGDAVLNSDGKLHATVTWVRAGDKEVQLRAAFRTVPENRWDELVQQLSYLSGFGGKISEPSVSAIEEIETPLKYSYTYERESYGRWENGETSPFMPRILLPDLPDPAKDAEAKKIDIYLGTPDEFVMHSRMRLPAGSDLFIPEPKVEVVEPFAEYHATYAYKGAVLEATRVLTIKQYMVPAAQYDALRAFIKRIDDDQDRFLTLHASVHPLDTIYTNVDAAQQEADKGTAAGHQLDCPAAIDHYRKAIELDPKIKGAWSAIAVCEVTRSTDEAVGDWHKEIQLNPDWLPAYRQLASVLTMLKRYDEAADVWRELLKVTPDDGDAYANFGNTLALAKKYPEAIAEYKTAVEKNPSNAVIRRLYGVVAVKAGDHAGGLAEFAKAIELDPSADTYNAAAWELADDNVELDHAQEWAGKSLALTEQRTRAIHLDNLQKEDLRAIVSLGNIWDTVGWVYYRQGKLAEAEQFLKPAWELTQNKQIGEHLVEVYEKEHKAERSRWTRATVERPATPDTVKLPWVVKGKNWSAEVFLLLAPDGKNGAKPAGVHFLDPEKALPELTKALMGANYDTALPPGSDARIVRKGIVYCGTYVGCAVTLLLPNDVQDVQ